MNYFNSIGKKVLLGKEIGKGAAATVFTDSSNPNIAIKLFHDEVLIKEKNLIHRLKKLFELTKIVDFTIKIGPHVKSLGSFPGELVFNSSKQLVGYQMELIQKGISLSEIVEGRNPSTAFKSILKNKKDPQLYNQFINHFLYDPKSTIYNRLVLCRNLALVFSKMYPPRTKSGSLIDLKILNFDIKPLNIMVQLFPVDGKFAIVPYILDLDNVTLKTKTQILSPVSPQITLEYKAPELPTDEYYDYFSLAVILYQLIFDTHPYTVLGGTRFSDSSQNHYFINNHCFAWGKNRKFLSDGTKNDWRHNNFNKVSPEIQNLFIRAFDSQIPNQRPTPLEWFEELRKFLINNQGKMHNLFQSA